MSELKEAVAADNTGRMTASLPTINWKEFFCGWGAGFINIGVMHPVNKLLFRQMLHGQDARSAMSQMKKEGIFILYRGILPPLCQKTLTISLMFGVYNEVYQRLLNQNMTDLQAKVLGGIASGFSEIMLVPFERIQALLCDAHYHDKLKNMAHAAVVINKEYGFAEFFRGTVPFLIRIAPTNAIFFIGREEVHKLFPPTETPLLRMMYEFASGAALGSFLSCVFYPFTVVKISMQTKLGGPFENSFIVLARIYTQRGRKLRYIFYGVPTNVTRAFVSWGIMNAAYELLKMFVFSDAV